MLSRLPFLGTGYGTDVDAWRAVEAGRSAAETGHYVLSRSPGYPVQELSYSLFYTGGPLATNGLSALASAAATICFALSVRRLGSRDVILTALALAFAPVVFINSTCSMDYVWSLAFQMAALLLVLEPRPTAAGILAGLAIGSRITSGAMLVPLGLLLVGSRANAPRESVRKDVRSFIGASLVVGGLCFLPVAWEYGLGFFSYYEGSYPRVDEILGLAIIEVWGLSGALAILFAIGSGFRAPPGSVRSLPSVSNPMLGFACAAAIGLQTVAFLRLPYEAGYLIPAIPFALITLARWSRRIAFQVLCIAILMASTIPDGITRVSIHADQARRRKQVARAEETIDAAHRLNPGSTVVLGALLPVVNGLMRDREPMMPGVTFLYSIESEEAHRLRSSGQSLHYLPGKDEYFLDATPESVGATPLVMPDT